MAEHLKFSGNLSRSFGFPIFWPERWRLFLKHIAGKSRNICHRICSNETTVCEYNTECIHCVDKASRQVAREFQMFSHLEVKLLGNLFLCYCSSRNLDYINTYSQGGCKLDCLSRVSAEQCGCRHIYMPYKNGLYLAFIILLKPRCVNIIPNVSTAWTKLLDRLPENFKCSAI
jgi:hypothetical protein